MSSTFLLKKLKPRLSYIDLYFPPNGSDAYGNKESAGAEEVDCEDAGVAEFDEGFWFEGDEDDGDVEDDSEDKDGFLAVGCWRNFEIRLLNSFF